MNRRAVLGEVLVEELAQPDAVGVLQDGLAEPAGIGPLPVPAGAVPESSVRRPDGDVPAAQGGSGKDDWPFSFGFGCHWHGLRPFFRCRLDNRSRRKIRRKQLPSARQRDVVDLREVRESPPKLVENVREAGFVEALQYFRRKIHTH